ncbi:MAG: tetratricopeptide repeat protein, partial [Myxococcales bacterium]|nr:tetratricopeptide repeat protein [Myxococcales bacterium]
LDLPLPQSPPSMPSLEGLTIPRPPPAAPPRRALPGLLGLGILALVGFGLAFVGGLTALAFMTSRGPQGAAVTVRPRVVDEGPVLPRVQADALETPAPPPDPEPAPAPAVSVRGLVAEGWRHVDTDPARARGLFERALGAQPGNADANYGYGYALLTEGRPIDAQPYLCRALANGDTETQREIRALVAKHHLTCN